eukprot:Hpha_TRINITY_DN22924_c0_g1::TRINITY_DN22924_c0_g1_i1::g.154163::m.154163
MRRQQLFLLTFALAFLLRTVRASSGPVVGRLALVPAPSSLDWTVVTREVLATAQGASPTVTQMRIEYVCPASGCPSGNCPALRSLRLAAGCQQGPAVPVPSAFPNTGLGSYLDFDLSATGGDSARLTGFNSISTAIAQPSSTLSVLGSVSFSLVAPVLADTSAPTKAPAAAGGCAPTIPVSCGAHGTCQLACPAGGACVYQCSCDSGYTGASCSVVLATPVPGGTKPPSRITLDTEGAWKCPVWLLVLLLLCAILIGAALGFLLRPWMRRTCCKSCGESSAAGRETKLADGPAPCPHPVPPFLAVGGSRSRSLAADRSGHYSLPRAPARGASKSARPPERPPSAATKSCGALPPRPSPQRVPSPTRQHVQPLQPVERTSSPRAQKPLTSSLRSGGSPMRSPLGKGSVNFDCGPTTGATWDVAPAESPAGRLDFSVEAADYGPPSPDDMQQRSPSVLDSTRKIRYFE